MPPGCRTTTPPAHWKLPNRCCGPGAKQAARRGIRCEALVREGQAAHQIAAAVRQFQADRVLVGTRSRSKIGKLLIGSVAEQVLRSVYLPVITVGPEAHLPVDSSQEAQSNASSCMPPHFERPLARARRLPARSRLPKRRGWFCFTCFRTSPRWSVKDLPTGMDSSAMVELRILAEQTGAGCCSAVEPIVAHGNPSIEILALAQERHASLIVLGATRRSAFENLTRDRTVYRVLAHALCPVLTLREPQAMPEEIYAETSAARH